MPSGWTLGGSGGTLLAVTRCKALCEARRRWGVRAVVRGPVEGSPRFLVGFVRWSGANEVWVGTGLSWEEALSTADEVAQAVPGRHRRRFTMTRCEALCEARRRWGARAVVRGPADGSSRFLVGVARRDGATEAWVGTGLSWEEALSSADEVSRTTRRRE